MNLRLPSLRALSSERVLRAVALAFAIGVAFHALRTALTPLTQDWTSLGVHDWDTHTSHRWLTVLSLREHGEGPWWNPFHCGGYPGWGYSEGAPNLVSPFTWAYFRFPIPVAIRVEVIGATVIAFVGACLAAARHTRVVALWLVPAILFALNTRWALQIQVGHTWHLAYAYMPWALWAFEKGVDEARPGFSALAGVFIALMLFVGGIYPVPHTALLLSIVAMYRAARASPSAPDEATPRRLWIRLRPIGHLALAGVLSLLLSAPKLLPVIDTMRRSPRLVDSVEQVTPHHVWLMLTEMTQPAAALIRGVQWQWHEHGCYVGVAGAAIMLFGAMFPMPVRGSAIRWVGILYFCLAFGAFARYAPWVLLHKLPIFASQRVPTRFLFPATLLLSLAFVAAVGARILRANRARPWIEVALLVPVGWLAIDLAHGASTALQAAFTHEVPEITRAESFSHASRPPVGYARPDWSAPSYLGMRANVGTLDCGAVPLDFTRGAIAKQGFGYQGEAYVDGVPEASARVVGWSPNAAIIEVEGAKKDAVLVYNMNWDPSWRSDVGQTLEWKHAVGVRLPLDGSVRVSLRYRPRSLNMGIGIAAFAVLAMAGWGAFAAWRRAAPRGGRGPS